MKQNILVINIAKEKLHYFEFVKPITDILDKNKIKYKVCDYRKINKSDLLKCSHIIICGTSLYDNEFVKNVNKFKWIKNIDKPLLGICGGMQIIGLVFGGKIGKQTEIGYYYENFNPGFFNLNGRVEVYHLHNNVINDISDFLVFNEGFIIQAMKHIKKEIYGVLFHPEVRNKEIIIEFIKR